MSYPDDRSDYYARKAGLSSTTNNPANLSRAALVRSLTENNNNNNTNVNNLNQSQQTTAAGVEQLQQQQYAASALLESTNPRRVSDLISPTAPDNSSAGPSIDVRRVEDNLLHHRTRLEPLSPEELQHQQLLIQKMNQDAPTVSIYSLLQGKSSNPSNNNNSGEIISPSGGASAVNPSNADRKLAAMLRKLKKDSASTNNPNKAILPEESNEQRALRLRRQHRLRSPDDIEKEIDANYVLSAEEEAQYQQQIAQNSDATGQNAISNAEIEPTEVIIEAPSSSTSHYGELGGLNREELMQYRKNVNKQAEAVLSEAFVESKSTGEFIKLTKKDIHELENQQEPALGSLLGTLHGGETAKSRLSQLSSHQLALLKSGRLMQNPKTGELQYSGSNNAYNSAVYESEIAELSTGVNQMQSFLGLLLLSSAGLLLGITLLQVSMIYSNDSNVFSFVLAYSSTADSAGKCSFVLQCLVFSLSGWRIILESFDRINSLDISYYYRYYMSYSGSSARKWLLAANSMIFLCYFISSIVTFVSNEADSLLSATKSSFASWPPSNLAQLQLITQQGSYEATIKRWFQCITARLILSGLSFLLISLKFVAAEHGYTGAEQIRLGLTKKLAGGITERQQEVVRAFLGSGLIYRSDALNIQIINNGVGNAQGGAGSTIRR
jgi:hypothetical protein